MKLIGKLFRALSAAAKWRAIAAGALGAVVIVAALALAPAPATEGPGLALFAAPAAEAHTLKYRTAKRAVQKRANRLAHRRTRVTTLMRLSRHRYYAQAEWSYTDPTGCKDCGYDPDTGALYDTPTTVNCWAEFRAYYRGHRTRRVSVRVDSRSCN